MEPKWEAEEAATAVGAAEVLPDSRCHRTVVGMAPELAAEASVAAVSLPEVQQVSDAEED